MTSWFVRLGAYDQPQVQNLSRALANNSVVKIGYGIEKDLTKENKDGIREDLIARGKYTERRTELIDYFINWMQDGDGIVCPFENRTETIRIGKVVGECGTVESFFKGNEKVLDDLIQKYPDKGLQGNKKIKPARKVIWHTPVKLLTSFSPKIQDILSSLPRDTVSDLRNIGDKEIFDLLD